MSLIPSQPIPRTQTPPTKACRVIRQAEVVEMVTPIRQKVNRMIYVVSFMKSN